MIRTNHGPIVSIPPILDSHHQCPLPLPSSRPSASSLSSPLTSDVQLALHFVRAQLVDRHAGVFASVEGARLANVEGQHSLVVPHQELGILTDDHLVLHPDNLRLRREKDTLVNNQVQRIQF